MLDSNMSQLLVAAALFAAFAVSAVAAVFVESVVDVIWESLAVAAEECYVFALVASNAAVAAAVEGVAAAVAVKGLAAAVIGEAIVAAAVALAADVVLPAADWVSVA